MPPISPPTPEVKQFLEALEGFLENPPRDLPEGAVDTMTNLSKSLRGYSGPQELSPGEREVYEQQGKPSSDLGESFKTAARGPDKATEGQSPGQQEATRLAEQAKELAAGVASLSDSSG